MEKKYKAIAKHHLIKEGWYDFEKGTEFKVLNLRMMIQVEDNLGFQYWMKPEDLEIIEIN